MNQLHNLCRELLGIAFENLRVMRIVLLISLLVFITKLNGQTIKAPEKADSVITTRADTLGDPRPRSAYGDLMNDDPSYYRRSPVAVTAVRVLAADVFNWSLARYVFNYDWARTSLEQWKKNLHSRWEWDNDRFGVNF